MLGQLMRRAHHRTLQAVTALAAISQPIDLVAKAFPDRRNADFGAFSREVNVCELIR